MPNRRQSALHSFFSPARRTNFAVLVLYAFSLLQMVRFYSRSTTFYLKLPAYLSGNERLPFQERVLPILFIKPLLAWTWFMQHAAHYNGAFTAERGPFYLLSLLSLTVAALFTQRLYSIVTATHELRMLVFPVFLYTVVWTYVLHSEANYSYPYDFPSLAFFSAGLYFIYTRQYWALLLVVLIGTFNRETTLFLIGIYLIDTGFLIPGTSIPATRFSVRSVPWMRVALLSLIWLAIDSALKFAFRHNDTSEDFLRIHYNLNLMRIRLIPALLNLCGYTLPLVVLLRRSLYPERFRRWLLILLPWLVIMFLAGVMIETRIYGELCSYSAVAVVLLIEQHLRVPETPEPNAYVASRQTELEETVIADL